MNQNAYHNFSLCVFYRHSLVTTLSRMPRVRAFLVKVISIDKLHAWLTKPVSMIVSIDSTAPNTTKDSFHVSANRIDSLTEMHL